MPTAIDIKGLTKVYPGGLQALSGIDLLVDEGAFFGLLGPNGAGKSTTIGILCSLVNKTQGKVKIMGIDIDQNWSKAKQFLGVVPQEFNFNIFESCLQIVVNQAGFYGIPKRIAEGRAEELFTSLEMWDKRHMQARTLSGGFKRRLMIARGLIHKPKVLILDEPTAGVDISLRRSMWTFLESLNKEGYTIILTTHYLEEAESLCERIAIIDKGRIIEDGMTSTLLQKLSSEVVIMYCKSLPTTLPILPGTIFLRIDHTTLEVELTKQNSLTDVITFLSQHQIEVDRMKNKSNRLEELFMKLVKS